MKTITKRHPHYVTDSVGRQTGVILPIGEYDELLQDLADLAIVAERRAEPTLSHEQVVAELKAGGLLEYDPIAERNRVAGEAQGIAVLLPLGCF